MTSLSKDECFTVSDSFRTHNSTTTLDTSDSFTESGLLCSSTTRKKGDPSSGNPLCPTRGCSASDP